MVRSRVVVAAVAIAMGLAAPASAAAPAQSDIAVAPVLTAGEVPEYWNDEIAAAVQDSFAQGERTSVRLLAAGDCEGEICDDAAVKGATHLVRVRLAAQSRVYTLRISAIDLATGERFESREECPLCGLAEVVEMAARQSRVLAGKLDRLATAIGWVTIDTRPAGADITVDGEPKGRTPATLALAPGSHEVALQRRGYNSTSRRITSVADVRETWAVDLVPREHRDTRARALTIAGGVLVGVAAAPLVAGSALLAVDGKQYRRRCSGEDVDPQGDCRFRFSSNVHGGVLVGLAAALVIGGIVMLTQARRPARAAGSRTAAIPPFGSRLASGARGGALEVHW
jgi:hypothetical protein